jgi:ribosome-binding factor A
MMMKERLLSAITKAAAEFIARESNYRSLITVTRTQIDSRGRSATIFISVYPDKDTRAATEFLDRRRDEFRQFLKSKINVRALPRIRFLPEPDRDMMV